MLCFILFVLLLSLLLSGCASSPPAIPVCTELTLKRAYCVNTVTSDEFYVDDEHTLNGSTYWEMRPTMVLLPYSSWVQLKRWIITECALTKACDERISSWNRTLDAVDKMTEEK
jgi:hypothetical protein